MMKIAHLSDLHLLSLRDLTPRQMLNKRFTGYVNIKLKRGSIHKPFAVRALAAAIREQAIDHVVITGDLSNLALESEFELVKQFLQEDLAMPADQVSLVPGNHDAYVRGPYQQQRFEHHFADYLSSDVADSASTAGRGTFPYVRLRGPVAIIGLSSAVPRLPLVSSGQLGAVQRADLRRMLAHPEVKQRTPVILQHHPWHNPASRTKTLLEGLLDAAQVRPLLEDLPRGLLLHGHLHRRIHRHWPTKAGQLDAVGSTSASLLHDDPNRMSGFNVYEMGESGAIGSIEAFKLAENQRDVIRVDIPRRIR